MDKAPASLLSQTVGRLLTAVKIPVQRKYNQRMNRATRVATSTIGIYAGLLGALHGCFELMQGNIAPGGIGIHAIGTPCQADAVWHACLPAMTVVPNLVITGALAIIVSLIALVWAAKFIHAKNGGLILVLLSILMLLVGAGFIPPYAGILAGIVGGRINKPLPIQRIFRFGRIWNFLAKLWPWTLIAFVGWSIGGWILGYYFNQIMMNLSFILFFFCNLGLPLLTVFSGLARDIINRDHAVAA